MLLMLQQHSRRLSRENRAAVGRPRPIDTNRNMRYFDKIQRKHFIPWVVKHWNALTRELDLKIVF